MELIHVTDPDVDHSNIITYCMKLVLSDAERSEMKLFYEEELSKTIKRLQHLQNVLGQLESDVKIEVLVAGGLKTPSAESPSKSSQAKKKRRKRRRGRKSIWGDFILKTIKENNRPMKYNEIIQAAQIRFNVPDSKMKTLKAAINQSAFRLRTIHKKLETVGEEGKKEKFLALSSMFDDKGLKAEYHSYIN